MTAVDDYQSSDILGGKSTVGPGRVPQGPFTSRNFFLLLIVSAAGLVAFYQFRAWFRKYQEERRRLAYRRRNGIPDSDHRAFNVAYAAAQRAKENGAPRRPLFPTLKEPSEPRGAVGGDLRQRSNNAVSHSLMAPMGNQPNSGLQPAWESRPSFPQQPSPQIPGYLHGLSSNDLSQYQVGSSAKGRETSKTASGDSPPQAPAEDASTYNTPADTPADLFIRKPKRSANPTSDEGESPSPEFTRHDKRRRKVSNKSIAPQAESPDVEMDDISALPPSLTTRGKKRDRAEAGSTMGDEDAAELGIELHRRRRRKHRQSGLVPTTRGQKRDRASDVTSEDESEGHRLRGKSTRRRQNHSSPSTSEDAMEQDAVVVVLDPACKGRKVGEVWELHGKTYKVGPTGRRLTRSFIKTDAPVYNMPADSHHPDRDISREIFIEQWLTDEEYKDASDRQVHAHQSPVKPTISTELARQIRAPLENAGKQMLWGLSTHPSISSPLKSSFSSTSSLPASPRRSIPGTPLPPPAFPSTPGQFRRVTSGLALGGGNGIKAVESPRGPRLSLTKMQKQEREAALYGEIRRKEEEAERKKAEEEEARRKAMAPPPVPAPAASTPAPAPVPAPTPAAASTSTPAEPPKSGFSFPPLSGFPKPADKPSEKPAQAASTAPASFSFGSTSAAPAPAPTPAAAPATNTSSSIPNFFGNRGHSTTPAASAPTAPGPPPAPEPPHPGTAFTFGGVGAANSMPMAAEPKPAAQTQTSFSFPPKQDGSGSSNASGSEPAKEASKPMFNFANTKPASPARSAPSAPAAEAPKPAATFNFGTTASKPADPAAPKPAPAFGFGGSGGQSAFGGASSGTSAFGQTKPASPAPAAGASNPFGASSGTSAFGQTKAPSPAPATSNAFGGASTGTSAFGQTQAPSPAPATNVFGGASSGTSAFGQTKPAESTPAPSATNNAFGGASASNSAFGQTNAPAAGASNPFGAFAPKPAEDKNKDAAKPASAFGSFGGGAAGDKGKEAEKPTFNFGAANGAKSAFGGSGTSAFGSTSGAASPFAASPASTPAAGTAAKPATFAFGATSTPQPASSDKPAAKSAFGSFGAGTNPNANSSASPFGGAAAKTGGAFGSSAFGASTSAFGSSNAASNSASGTSSPFGMPTPTAEQPAKSASFSFGSTTGGGAFGSSGTGAFGAKPGGGSFSFGTSAANGEKKEGAPAPGAFSFGTTEKK